MSFKADLKEKEISVSREYQDIPVEKSSFIWASHAVMNREKIDVVERCDL